jgi:hypothetical protein
VGRAQGRRGIDIGGRRRHQREAQLDRIGRRQALGGLGREVRRRIGEVEVEVDRARAAGGAALEVGEGMADGVGAEVGVDGGATQAGTQGHGDVSSSRR